MLWYDDRSDAALYEDAEAELNEIVEESVDRASRGRTWPRPAPGTRGWTLPPRPKPTRRPSPGPGRQPDLRRLASSAALHIRMAIRGEPVVTMPPLARAEALVSQIIQVLTGLANTLPGSTVRIIRSLIQRFDAERRAIMRARLGPATDFDALRRAAQRITVLAEMAVRAIAGAPGAI
ncbi:MAG: hypothetical protein H6R26_1447 [Proteobacteria bacterium]|nr:hypothetical protein [Pseudomonadota bacterium]